MTHRTGRLATAASLYLRQHASNPVEWFEWGPEAFERAQQTDRPVLVSIGYASCHWCHVMERECFEDATIAAMQNALFVSIKVDREERPDIDRVYMAACQALTGQGGWPLNVFVTPDGRPFYAGTFFGAAARYGRPSWPEVLTALGEAWRDRRQELLEHAAELVEAVRAIEGLEAPQRLTAADLERVQRALVVRIDPVWGGFGSAPKFPAVASVELLLAALDRRPDPGLRALVGNTLDRMFDGGLHDHLGGGFMRYATDARWEVPHFEKMLYDNGLLLRLYTEALRQGVGGTAMAALEGVAGFVLSELRTDDGTFAASVDADSDGHEGRFYVWSRAQLDEALGREDAAYAASVFGVGQRGNVEGSASSTLTLRSAHIDTRKPVNLLPGDDQPNVTTYRPEDRRRFEEVRVRLLEARRSRPAPMIDPKVITAWNALAIEGLARAGAVAGRTDWIDAAERAIDWLASNRTTPHGPWQRVDGLETCFADDTAAIGLAYLALANATGSPAHLLAAVDTAAVLLTHFWDRDHAALRYSTDPPNALFAEPRGCADDAVPSATGQVLLLWARLVHVANLPGLPEALEAGLASVGGALRQAPAAHATIGRAFGVAHHGARVAVLTPVHTLDAAARAAVARSVGRRLGPDDVLVIADPDLLKAPRISSDLFENRAAINQRDTWWICRSGACEPPRHALP